MSLSQQDSNTSDLTTRNRSQSTEKGNQIVMVNENRVLYVNPKRSAVLLYGELTLRSRMRGMLESFTFRVKIGEYEVELRGAREEVLKTIDDLPKLVANVQKAFESAKPKTVTTLTVKTEPSKAEAQKYPKITNTESCDEAIVRALETDWGKWRPRTLDELKEALQANGLSYPGRVLAGVLMGLVKKGKIRRWNTDAGFVYILAEEETMRVRGEAE